MRKSYLETVPWATAIAHSFAPALTSSRARAKGNQISGRTHASEAPAQEKQRQNRDARHGKMAEQLPVF